MTSSRLFRPLLLAALALCGTARAQDLIVRTDSSRIEARVTEIAPETVRYKRFSNPDGPTYILPAGSIAYIRYANGEVDRFAPAPTPAGQAAPAAPSAQAAAPQPSTEEADYRPRRYQPGDYYRRGNVEGVVAVTTDDGLHGLIVSLEELYLHWSEFRKPDLREVGATDRRDGRANMARVEAYIAQHNLSWADFPAFAWCRGLGEGWYLPAIDELLNIGNGYHGGTRTAGRQARNLFNETLKRHGGKRMDRMVYYFSSTEADDRSAYTSHMGIEPPFVVEIPKYNKFLVRAVHRF